MTFEEIVDQAIDMVRRRGRVTYRMLKRQFDLDDEALEDLKIELIKGQRLAVDEDGEVLVWTGDTESASSLPTSVLVSAPAIADKPPPISYTPQYLSEKILTSRAALEGERKQVTVMFADIKDSTELIRNLDPEAAQQLLDPAIHIMMDAVHCFEGTVNQVLGDGIMAIFGAPVSHEDHAARACYAALSMQSAMQPYADEMFRSHGITMRIRVGLNSGEVVVRTIGNDLHMDYSAVGQTTNLASRMEQLAAPGSITLTSATLRLVEGLVRVNERGPVPVKGMSEPVDVFELTGASTVRRRLQAAVARGLTKFVGRDTEIEALNQARERAEAGNGQIIAAVGEVGVGKSRLVYEFVHSHRTQGWLVLESASVSYGKATPYFPVIDLLKRYVHVEDGDESRTIRAKVTGQIMTLDESLQETIPALLSLLDALPEDSPFLQLDPLQRRQRTREGLKRILLRESQVQPLLLVFEDLHWIDSETQALLDSLVESLPTAQILLLVNYRPEYQHGWGSKTYYIQLRLDPLAPASAGALLQALLGNEPSLEPLNKLLLERTAGNPFFLEESVRTLVENEVLVGQPGVYGLAQDVPTIQVPDTVQAILAARIDRLPQEEKQLLQTAAVIGTEVPYTLLQAIAEMPEEGLYGGLAHLQGAEFLYETSLFPERVYTFKHALTHDVAYGSLLQERRRRLHARIVEVLEALAGDGWTEQVEQLAHHALRGEMWDKALAYFRQAGAKANERSAYPEAVACFEQSLQALDRLPQRRDIMELAIDLNIQMRHALFPLRESERLLGVLCEAETLAEALDDPYRLGLVINYLGHYHWMSGEPAQAETFAQRAVALATSLEHFDLQIAAKTYLGYYLNSLGNYQQARHCGTTVVTSLTAELRYAFLGMGILPSVASRVWLAWTLAEMGMFSKAILHGEEGLRIAEAIDHPYTHTHACFGIGLAYIRQGEFIKAIPVLERGHTISQTYITSASPVNDAHLGYALALSGRVPEAISCLEDAVEQAVATRLLCFHSLWVAWLSEVYLLAGDLERAHTLALQALDCSQSRKEQGHQAWALHLLGDIAMHRHPSDTDRAETPYRQALTLADELGMRPLQAHCHRGLGALYRQTGQAEQARAELSTAIEMYRDMEMPFWLPETEAALSDLEGKA